MSLWPTISACSRGASRISIATSSSRAVFAADSSLPPKSKRSTQVLVARRGVLQAHLAQAGGEPDQRRLAGSVSFTFSRYIHLSTDLELTDAPLPARPEQTLQAVQPVVLVRSL